MKKTILKTQNLGISFGGLKAVQNVNLDIREGEIYGLIGPNGAGKTTVFNLLAGVYRPTTGDQPPRHRPHVPEHSPFLQYVRPLQRDDGTRQSGGMYRL